MQLREGSIGRNAESADASWHCQVLPPGQGVLSGWAELVGLRMMGGGGGGGRGGGGGARGDGAPTVEGSGGRGTWRYSLTLGFRYHWSKHSGDGSTSLKRDTKTSPIHCCASFVRPGSVSCSPSVLWLCTARRTSQHWPRQVNSSLFCPSRCVSYGSVQ